jgi:hypothetical protein
VPPDCPACPTVEPPVRAPAPHDILKNRYISIDPTAGVHISMCPGSTLRE